MRQEKTGEPSGPTLEYSDDGLMDDLRAQGPSCCRILAHGRYIPGFILPAIQ
jgi:hypothetical protein